MTDQQQPGAEPQADDALPHGLQHSIQVHFPEGDLAELDKIAAAVARDSSAWAGFRGEFEAALRDHTLTPERFQRLTDQDDYGDDTDWDWNELDRTARDIWRSVAPGRTFPWDEPGLEPPQLADHPTEHGVSFRLAYTLKSLVFNGNPGLLDRAMRRGIVPHVPRLLEPAVRAGQFTPTSWAWIGYLWGTDPDTISAETVDQDLRRVWSVVYPGRPFPRGTAP